jgi:hypothetical protein
VEPVTYNVAVPYCHEVDGVVLPAANVAVLDKDICALVHLETVTTTGDSQLSVAYARRITCNATQSTGSINIAVTKEYIIALLDLHALIVASRLILYRQIEQVDIGGRNKREP